MIEKAIQSQEIDDSRLKERKLMYFLSTDGWKDLQRKFMERIEKILKSFFRMNLPDRLLIWYN